jgi:hypothetical protein
VVTLFGMRSSIVFGSVLILVGVAQAQIKIPGGGQLPDLKLPSIQDLIRGEAPLTMTIKDAPLMGWDEFKRLGISADVKVLGQADKTEKGTFMLDTGQYKMTIRSFCCRGYTYGPTQGMGYLLGPWKGSKSGFVRELLSSYGRNPSVEQRDVQLLIWAVIARVKPQDMNEGAQRALVQLMGKDGGKLLADGALDYFAGRAADDLFKKASKELKPVLEFENKIRGLHRQANAKYEEFERLAVLEPQEELKSEVPRGTWNLAPGGYLIRFDPAGYSKTEVEVIVPRRAEMVRDELRRVTQMKWADGFTIDLKYTDVEPVVLPQDARMRALQVAEVRISGPGLSAPVVSTKTDFVLQGVPTKKKSTAETLHLYKFSYAMLQGWWESARDRYEDVQELNDRIETYEEWSERMGRIERGERPEEDLFDGSSIQDMIESLFGGTDDRLEVIGDTHGRLAEHLAHATGVIGGLGDGTEVDPSDFPIIPANGGSQNLGGSSNVW